MRSSPTQMPEHPAGDLDKEPLSGDHLWGCQTAFGWARSSNSSVTRRWTATSVSSSRIRLRAAVSSARWPCSGRLRVLDQPAPDGATGRSCGDLIPRSAPPRRPCARHRSARSIARRRNSAGYPCSHCCPLPSGDSSITVQLSDSRMPGDSRASTNPGRFRESQVDRSASG